MADAVRLPHQIAVQRDAHHQRASSALLQHHVKRIPDHRREPRGFLAAAYDLRNIVQFLRIGHGQDASGARFQPDWLVVVTPVEQVLIACFGEQVRRVLALADPGAEPALRRRARAALEFRCRRCDERALVSLFERALAFGVAAAVACDLVPARGKGFGESWRCVEECRIHQYGRGHSRRSSIIAHARRTDPVAVVTPGEVQNVRLRSTGCELGAEALSEGEALEVHAEIDRQGAAPRARRSRRAW